MGYSFGPFLFSFLRQIVEEEIDKDGIHFGIGLEQKKLAAK